MFPSVYFYSHIVTVGVLLLPWVYTHGYVLTPLRGLVSERNQKSRVISSSDLSNQNESDTICYYGCQDLRFGEDEPKEGFQSLFR